MLIYKPSLNIVATILARDEEDIIARNIEHHIKHGVSKFIVTDNGSVDNTRSIVAKYPEVVEIIDEPGRDHRQSEWVTRMAKIACKLQPDWIVHLDADELWCGLPQLKHIQAKAIGSTKMFLHPPTANSCSLEDMRYYLDFEQTGLPGECKVAHRPDPDIVITHGNHACNLVTYYTKEIWRHHYPVRSYSQFARKAVDGHQSLTARGAVCDRWKKWHDLYLNNQLAQLYESICHNWSQLQEHPNTSSLTALMEFWSTDEVVEFFRTSQILPTIGEWPKL
jgi:glycosyltransferase involved in cell wall biosynthesis